MLAGPTKAAELFARLGETTDTALKTRERVFSELKAALEQHVELEERHLFPILRKQPDTKDLVAAAIRDNKELRAKLGELDALPKNDETFLAQVGELQKVFRQHARDEKRELLPAAQAALSEEQVQGIAGKMETTLAHAEQARVDQAEEKRAAAKRERDEQAEAQARQDAAAKQARDAARAVTVAAERARDVAGKAVEQTVALAAAPQKTGVFFWDMMLGMSGAQAGRAAAVRDASAPSPARVNEEVIPLAEEVLVVGKRTVNTGTTRIRRYVVESAVEQQVSLVRERVVVERRRPTTTTTLDADALTEMTVEIVETDEVPVVAKAVQLREEIVVCTERVEHTQTVRDTVRQDQVEIEHANTRRPARAHA